MCKGYLTATGWVSKLLDHFEKKVKIIVYQNIAMNISQALLGALVHRLQHHAHCREQNTVCKSKDFLSEHSFYEKSKGQSRKKMG